MVARVVDGKAIERALWVDNKEIKHRQDKGLCLRCGSNYHFIGQCLQRPVIKPLPAPPIKMCARRACRACAKDGKSNDSNDADDNKITDGSTT